MNNGEHEDERYLLKLSAERYFGECEGQYYEYLVPVHGSIEQVDCDGNTIATAGRVSAYIVDFARAREEGESILDVLDSETADTAFFLALFGEGGWLREDLLEEHDLVFVERLLILDRTEVLPAHRGRGLGLWADYQLIETFAGTQNVLPVMMPSPLQFTWSGQGDDPMGYGQMTQDHEAALAKVTAYWAQMGYEKVWEYADGESIWILNPAHVLPDRREILRANRRR
jgi:GNAT superfamily N-acetyltransferase